MDLTYFVPRRGRPAQGEPSEIGLEQEGVKRTLNQGIVINKPGALSFGFASPSSSIKSSTLLFFFLSFSILSYC